MKYSIDKKEFVTTLTIGEENLNSLVAPDLKSDLIILKNEGVENLIIDMSQVKYVDSSGLSAILTGNRMWQEDGHYILTNITSPMVKKLIEISKLDTVLNIMESTDDAIRLLEAELVSDSDQEEDI